MLEFAPLPPGVLADLRDAQAEVVSNRPNLRPFEVEQRRVVPIADLQAQLPPGVAAVGAGQDQPAAGGPPHHAELDLTRAPVAGRAVTLHAVLCELAEEAALLQAELLGHLQQDLVAPAVRVR